MADRITAAEYRELAQAKPSRDSQKGSEPNPYRGLLCTVCAQRVLQREPAQMHTDLETGAVTVRHLGCKAAA